MREVLAEFWKVGRMPDATPRCWCGSEFMMPGRLGEANSPCDGRSAKSRSPKGA